MDNQLSDIAKPSKLGCFTGLCFLGSVILMFAGLILAAWAPIGFGEANSYLFAEDSPLTKEQLIRLQGSIRAAYWLPIGVLFLSNVMFLITSSFIVAKLRR